VEDFPVRVGYASHVVPIFGDKLRIAERGLGDVTRAPCGVAGGVARPGHGGITVSTGGLALMCGANAGKKHCPASSSIWQRTEGARGGRTLAESTRAEFGDAAKRDIRWTVASRFAGCVDGAVE